MTVRTPKAIALVARPDKTRVQLARYLRDASYEVTECDELASASRFAGVVLVDDAKAGEALRARVQTWIGHAHPPRVVVISARPTGWKALSLVLVEHLIVLAAPSFGWEIVDALTSLPDR